MTPGPNSLMPLVYDELRRIAARYISRERPGQTLQATALVNEAFLRFAAEKTRAFANRTHFLAIAALSMRQILVQRARARKEAQLRPAMIPLIERGGFNLLEATFGEEQAKAEALRCVQCTTFCDKCVEVCPNRANYTFKMTPVAWTLPQLVCRDDGLAVAGDEPFRVAQGRQILHVDDYCNECDDCQTFCVHRGRPYADKPRLFLDPASFAGATVNAFQIEGRMVRRREKGADSRLVVLDDGGMTFEDEFVHVRLSDDWQVAEAAAKQPFEGTRSLRTAAEMAVLLRGITRSLPFLLRT
jgi:putative selenate reductase